MKIVINLEIEFDDTKLIDNHTPHIIEKLDAAIANETYFLPALRVNGGIVAMPEVESGQS